MPRLLIPRQQYLASGIHIGSKQKTEQMKEFIYKIRPDGLAVLNLRKVDEKIRIAAKFLARANKILVVGRKAIAHEPIKKFCEIVECEAVTGRFMPGTLTNPNYKKFFEAEVILISDPLIDYQALKEAVRARVPVVAICDTINETKDIDLIIPANNKGKKALATLFWLLAREILKERGKIKSNEEFKYKIEDFSKEE
jgi:small subunit ribosomal protein S2